MVKHRYATDLTADPTVADDYVTMYRFGLDQQGVLDQEPQITS